MAFRQTQFQHAQQQKRKFTDIVPVMPGRFTLSREAASANHQIAEEFE